MGRKGVQFSVNRHRAELIPLLPEICVASTSILKTTGNICGGSRLNTTGPSIYRR